MINRFVIGNGGLCKYFLEKGNELGYVKINCENSIFKSLDYAVRNAVVLK